MEVKIGIENVSRELMVDSSQTGEEVQEAVAKALEGTERVLSLVDAKGRRVIVPVDKLAYVEIGSPTVGQVGFRS